MGGFSCVLMTVLIRVQMCGCAANNEPFRKPYFNQRGIFQDSGNHGVSKHLGGDFLHLLCIYSRACTAGLIISLSLNVCVYIY